MALGGEGYTIPGGLESIRERQYIEASLARALDDDPTPAPEPSVRVDADALVSQAERVAVDRGHLAARELLLDEVRLCRRWLRTIHLRLAGNDAVDQDELAEGWRATLARVALPAALYGLAAGVPTEQIVREVIAADALKLGAPGQWGTALVLAHCYVTQERPDLAVSVLLRSPPGEPWQELPLLLDTARRGHALGQVGRLRELLALGSWERIDPTGLSRDLLHRLITGREPTPAEPDARDRARQEAFEQGNWAALRELALFDVMWLEESPTLWQALSAILRLNGDLGQADLARQVGQNLAREGGPGG